MKRLSAVLCLVVVFACWLCAQSPSRACGELLLDKSQRWQLERHGELDEHHAHPSRLPQFR